MVSQCGAVQWPGGATETVLLFAWKPTPWGCVLSTLVSSQSCTPGLVGLEVVNAPTRPVYKSQNQDSLHTGPLHPPSRWRQLQFRLRAEQGPSIFAFAKYVTQTCHLGVKPLPMLLLASQMRKEHKLERMVREGRKAIEDLWRATEREETGQGEGISQSVLDSEQNSILDNSKGLRRNLL